MIFPSRILAPTATLALGLLAMLAAGQARAQVSFVDMFRSNSSIQTGNGNTLTSQGYFFNASLFAQNAGDFTGVSLSYPGPASPATFSQTSPLIFDYQTGFYATQADMDAAFPMGTYSYATTGGNAMPATATLDYAADGYPTAQPYLTGTDYTNLQNAAATSPITVHFTPFAQDLNAAAQFEFFTIYDNTLGGFVYDAGFLPYTTSGVTIAANTLASGHSFTYELIDSNRFTVTGSGAQFAPELAFDLRTQGQFSTAAAAVPEPGSIALFAASFLTGAGLLARRRKARRGA